MDSPIPPESIPNYLAEGIPKQETTTLHDLNAYVEELIEFRDQKVTEELTDDQHVVTDNKAGNSDKGTVVKEKVTCGDESCECMTDGEKHGPYLYRYFYKNGTLVSEYIGKP